jgi:hypothetical protein
MLVSLAPSDEADAGEHHVDGVGPDEGRDDAAQP